MINLSCTQKIVLFSLIYNLGMFVMGRSYQSAVLIIFCSIVLQKEYRIYRLNKLQKTRNDMKFNMLFGSENIQISHMSRFSGVLGEVSNLKKKIKDKSIHTAMIFVVSTILIKNLRTIWDLVYVIQFAALLQYC